MKCSYNENARAAKTLEQGVRNDCFYLLDIHIGDVLEGIAEMFIFKRRYPCSCRGHR